MYVEYFINEVKKGSFEMTEKRIGYFREFLNNMFDGINYYRRMFPKMLDETSNYRANALEELQFYKTQLETFIEENAAIRNLDDDWNAALIRTPTDSYIFSIKRCIYETFKGGNDEKHWSKW